MNASVDTLPQLIFGPAGPDRVAIVVPGEDTTITFGELEARVGHLARSLHAAGVRRGERISVIHPDGPAFVQVLLATLALGVTAAPLNPAYTEEEVAFYLDDLQPRLVLVPEGELAAARAAAARLGVELIDVRTTGPDVAIVGPGGTLVEPAAGEPEGPQPDDIAILLHTSGTTSRPKQVPLLHRNLAASIRSIIAHYGLGPGDVSFCAMPLFHIHGLVASVMSQLAAGGRVVLPRRFVPRGLVQSLSPDGVTWFSGSPTVLEMVLERADRIGDLGPIPDLRFIRSCSAALPARLMGILEERFGVPVVEAYGMTEASHQMAANPLPPAERKAGSVGVSAGAELGIMAKDGSLLPSGTQGEVVVRGPGITPGYLNNPTANAESFTNGWFRTGDLGTIDAEGYLRLEGRIKELVIRGGENISPYEVEAALASHPAVKEAACFGLPDEKYGEEVAAVVATEGEVSTDELLAVCKSQLAAFKVPKTLVVVDAIPRTATGKLQRQRLPQLLGLVEP